MKKLLLIMAFALSGCSTIQSVKEYWPRSHDPVMFDKLITIHFDIVQIDCEKPNWAKAKENSQHLAAYTEWRGDPQRKNIKGLYEHTVRMEKGGSKMFCELGKRTALQRINATKSAWEGR